MNEKLLNKLVIVINVFFAFFLSSVLNFAFCGLGTNQEISFFAHFISMIAVAMIFILLTAIFKKSYRTVYVISATIFIFAIINNIKFYYTNNPIYFSDIYFLSNIGEISGLVKLNIFLHLRYLILLPLLVVLLAISFISKLYYVEIKDKPRRIILGILSFLVLILLFIPIDFKDRFLLNNVYSPQKRKDYKAMINNVEYYQKFGVIAGMYGIQIEDRSIAPESYDEKEIESLIESKENSTSSPTTIAGYKYPNIIIMFQESYFDVQKLDGVDFDKNVTENVEKLKEKGNHVKMLSSTYGGLSCNVEFELLTGGNLAFFSQGYTPFMQMYRNRKSKDNPSILKELERNNYYTKVVFGRDYFNSGNVYKKLGVNEYVNEYKDREDYESHVKGNYISDHALTSDVINELKNKTNEKSLFYMTCTIQSHMPFYKDKYKDYDIHITNSTLSKNEQDVLLSYSQGIYDTNVELMRLYNEVQNIEEPTVIIILLGDHLPYLYNNQGEDILLKNNYFNSGNETEKMLKKYSTEVLTLSNYEYIPSFKYNYVSPDYILTRLVKELGMDTSPYFDIINETHENVSALNQYLLIDEDGNVLKTDETMPQNIQEIYDLRRNLQYYYFKK